jgi:hypothetical protein
MHAIALLLSASALAQDSGVIRLEDPLDETGRDHYCADVVGTVVEPRLTIQAHTCKSATNDQLFATDSPRVGNISLPDDGLCLMAQRAVAGASIVTAACARDSRQRWLSTADGQIHPVDDESLCWTVSEGRGEFAGGDYLKRTLTLEQCADFGPRYNTWTLPVGSVGR